MLTIRTYSHVNKNGVEEEITWLGYIDKEDFRAIAPMNPKSEHILDQQMADINSQVIVGH